MTQDEKAEALSVAAGAEAVEAAPVTLPPRFDPKDRKAAVVDAVHDAKTKHADASTRVKALRAELADAVIAEAQSLNALQAARLVLKKEAEGEE